MENYSKILGAQLKLAQQKLKANKAAELAEANNTPVPVIKVPNEIKQAREVSIAATEVKVAELQAAKAEALAAAQVEPEVKEPGK